MDLADLKRRRAWHAEYLEYLDGLIASAEKSAKPPPLVRLGQGAGQRDYYGSGLVTDGEGETFMANENRPEIQTGNESELRRGDEP